MGFAPHISFRCSISRPHCARRMLEPHVGEHRRGGNPMKQVVLAGLVAGALAVGQPGAASAQTPATSGTKPQTGAGSEKASGTKPHTGPSSSSTQASGGASLGTVHLTHAVTANGQR